MSSPKWTKEQQAVIDSRNSNLLVAAAAGSGKTAVLVERIIQMITDKDNPIDIDKLLKNKNKFGFWEELLWSFGTQKSGLIMYVFQ